MKCIKFETGKVSSISTGAKTEEILIRGMEMSWMANKINTFLMRKGTTTKMFMGTGHQNAVEETNKETRFGNP